jgi:glycosyltransferase involved in cell wall biosynthesis
VVLACDFHLRYAAMLAGGLEGRGAAVSLLTRDHDLEFGDSPGSAERVIREAIGEGVEHRIVPGAVRSPRGWREAMRIRRQVRGLDPDVVHLQQAIGNDPRLLVASAPPRRRFALTVHDPSPHPGDPGAWRDHVSNLALIGFAGLIFVHGDALREELISRFDPKAPVVVVPHGSPSHEPVPLPDRRSVLFFGRISHYKGIDILLDAMGQVWREIPDATLTIAGEGSIEPHPALSDPRVTVSSGHIPDAEVPALIEAATCVALPYRQASQSGVGSRVKPYGRPLVVTAVGGLPELVADGSGLSVPPEDADALSAGLLSILADVEFAARLGAAGAATAAREGSWDAVARRTLDAYREHLGVTW